MHSRADIQDFFSKHRIAFVGVSRNPEDFSRRLLVELRARGYEVLPVNPAAEEIDGLEAYGSIADIQPPPEAALVMTPAGLSAAVVAQCAKSGVQSVWLHRGGGQGSVSDEAVAFCKEHGLKLVAGECPFMFLPETAFFHRVHGFFRRVGGSYPQ